MKKYNYCTYSDFNECLPYIDFPFYNESLIGYLLRLDYLNGFAPSSILRICLKIHNSDDIEMFLKEMTIEDLEENMDLEVISRLTNISLDYLNKMKLSTIRKKLFKYNCTITKENFRYGELKICPECLKQWKIPQIFFFDCVTTCLLHGFELISLCSCNRKIDLFDTTNELICNDCKTSYVDLLTTNHIEPNEYDSQYICQSILKTFLAEDSPIIRKNEKLIKGLIKRINYLENIKYEAFKAVLKTNYADKNSVVIFQRYSRNINDLLNLSFIISLIKEFNISPFQFSSFNSSDFNAKITTQLQSIIYRNQDSNSKKNRKIYCYNLKDNNYNQLDQSWQTISAFTDRKSVIFYEVNLISGRNIYKFKCCAYV